MAKRLSTIGRLIYSSVLGDFIGNQNKTNFKLIAQGKTEKFLDKNTGFKFSNNVALEMATLRSLSYGFSRPGIMRNYSDWWRKGDFTFDGDIDQDQYEQEIQSILNYELTRSTESIGETQPIENDQTILFRVLPFAEFALKQYQNEDFYNSEIIMNELHSLISLTHAYPRAVIAGGMFTFLLAQVSTQKDIKDALNDSIALTYEYYYSRVLFRSDLPNFAQLNMPDFSSIDVSKFKNDKSAISLLEKLYWILFSSDSLEKSLLLVQEHFVDDKVELSNLIYTIYGLNKRSNIDDDLVDFIDETTEEFNEYLKFSNRSGRFNYSSNN